LLPGFLVVQVRDFFVPARQRELFEQLAEVLAFALITYVIAGTVTGLRAEPQWMFGGWQDGEGGVGLPSMVPPWRSFELLRALVATAILLGVLVGSIEWRDLHYRLARRMRLTDRSGARDAWQEAFARNRKAWVLLHLSDGRRVRGWPVLSSERGQRAAVFVSSAAWVRDDGRTVPILGPGILITESAGISYAEFLTKS
jgi:hypothetical protein